MKTIYKYNLRLKVGFQMLDLPESYKILSVQMQRKELCLWVEVDTENPVSFIPFRYEIVGTGWPIDETVDRTYLASCQSGEYVWHVYQIHFK